MGKSEIYIEKIPLLPEDCFLVKQRVKSCFKFPLHTHKEFELNYLENAGGAIRIVGDSMEVMDDLDLVLVAGGTIHAYANHKCHSDNIFQITVQFHKSLFEGLFQKKIFLSIHEMFEKAEGGLVFSRKVILNIKEKLRALANDSKPDSFKNLLRLVEILKNLSLDTEAHSMGVSNRYVHFNHFEEDRLDSIMSYLRKNFNKRITLSEIAQYMNTSESTLMRFLKKWTGKTFVENLNEIRVEEAVCRLIDSSDSVSEICYKCGFNNLSNFNRIFKKQQKTTPTEFRQNYSQALFKL